MHKMSIDIESYSSVNLKEGGLYNYVQSPDFEILLFAYSIDDLPVEIIDLTKDEMPQSVIEALNNPQVLKVAFNVIFEWTCLRKFWPTPLGQWYCTMNHALYCGLPTALFQVCQALNLPDDMRKMSTGGALIRTFCCPVKPSKANGMKTRIRSGDDPVKWEQFKEYCRMDVVSEMAVLEKIKMFKVPEEERAIWLLDQAINLNGVLVDMDLLLGALHCDRESSEALMQEAISLTGLDNPNSRSQLLLWLSREMGEEVLSLTKESVKNLLGEGTVDAVCERVLRIRQELAKTSVAKYTAIDKALCSDGRIRGIVQYYGANRTGRWSGRAVQMQNLPKNTMEGLGSARQFVKARDVKGLGLLFGGIPDTLSQLVRTVFIPPEGKLLAVADFAAIEARVIAWLSGEAWRQEVFAGEGKIYEASAAKMFNVPIETIVKGGVNYDLRAKGKVAELACGYQGSVGALKAMGADKMGLDEVQLQEIIDVWRASNPAIVNFWFGMQNAAIDTIKTFRPNTYRGIVLRREVSGTVAYLTVQIPSGRKLYYAFPRIGANRWGGESISHMGMNQMTKKWVLLETYGGKLVENVVQAVARDCLAIALMKVHNAGYRIAFHVHDEIVCEVDRREDLGNICSIMEEPISWGEGLILRASGFTGNYYQKEG